jgi:DNA-binding response OmpR family regulator
MGIALPLLVSLILIAEDDIEMRRMLGAFLRRDGYSVELVSTGIELQERLELLARAASPPDLVIADIQMPGLTGLHVLAWTRRYLPRVPFILITAFGDARTHDRARNLGAAAVFDKPFEMDDLRSHVRAVLRGDEQDARLAT